MKLTKYIRPETWAILAAAISASMLAAAHAFEHFGGMAPCQLCLRQREVYWVALGLGLLLFLVRKQPKWRRGGFVLLGLVFLVGMCIAGYHAGIEQKFWPGPASCTSTIHDLSTLGGDLLNALNKPSNVPMCDQIPWALFGISMAGWNVLTSLALAIISFLFAWPRRKTQVKL